MTDDADDDCVPDITAAMEVWNARDKLVDDVFYGRMTPDEAEAEAIRLGLKSLAADPDPALYKPMAIPIWTLAMTVAWIVWRTEEAVRDNWDVYRCERSFWSPQRRQSPTDGGRAWKVTEGWRLKRLERATLFRLSLGEAYDDAMGGEIPKCISTEAAQAELWTRLTEGQLTAIAISAVSTKPVQIPSHEWAYLTAKADDGLADELRYRRTPTKVEYVEVSFGRADVIRLWPPLLGRQTARGEKACQKWLESEMRGSPDSRPKDKNQFKLVAREKFKISARSFNRAWAMRLPKQARRHGPDPGVPRRNHRIKITAPK